MRHSFYNGDSLITLKCSTWVNNMLSNAVTVMKGRWIKRKTILIILRYCKRKFTDFKNSNHITIGYFITVWEFVKNTNCKK